MPLCHVSAAAEPSEHETAPGLGINQQLSRDSLNNLKHDVEPGIHTMSKEIVVGVSDQGKRRQEAINEVIYTERDFVRDMEYLRNVFWFC